MQTIIFSSFLLIYQLSFCQKEDFNSVKYIPQEINYTYKLGDKTISFKSYQYGQRKDIVMINLHNDETTSVKAAMKVLEETGGLLFKIENDRQRIVSFLLHGNKISFDPNRMFTRKGIAASLKKFHCYSSHAVQKIEGFSKFILSKLPEKNKMLIALHNNDDGNYSIDSYAHGEFSKEVADVHVEELQDKDNFFFTTDPKLHKIVSAGYNSALQDNKNATDDGSLSVYYGKRKKSYINIEVELGNQEEQTKMLRFLLSKTDN